MQKRYEIPSLVLGIVSLCLLLLSIFWIPAIIGLVLAIIGMIFAKKAKKQGVKSKIAKGGFVTSLIGIILCGIMSLAMACPFLMAIHVLPYPSTDTVGKNEVKDINIFDYPNIMDKLDSIQKGLENKFTLSNASETSESYVLELEAQGGHVVTVWLNKSNQTITKITTFYFVPSKDVNLKNVMLSYLLFNKDINFSGSDREQICNLKYNKEITLGAWKARLYITDDYNAITYTVEQAS